MVETRLNDEVVQRASTNEMIFDVSTLISLLSDFTTLEPGDVLVTGTPAGAGMHRDPKRFFHAGDDDSYLPFGGTIPLGANCASISTIHPNHNPADREIVLVAFDAKT